jgi:ubiquitin-conjugating enzyme E2 T
LAYALGIDGYNIINVCGDGIFEVQLMGPTATPYEHLTFILSITFPKTFPFNPPILKFISTPPYHPNIDNRGNICLDVLKMPPHGAWKANLGIAAVLEGVKRLLNEPNLDDPLDTNIAKEFLTDYDAFLRNAKRQRIDKSTGA